MGDERDLARAAELHLRLAALRSAVEQRLLLPGVKPHSIRPRVEFLEPGHSSSEGRRGTSISRRPFCSAEPVKP